MIILGMVGTPAGGKSTAAEFIAGLGAEWINADLIARECLNHAEVVEALVSRFGSSVLAIDGKIDRAKIADLVFSNDHSNRDRLHFLESLVHPPTRLEITRRIVDAAQAGTRVALLDVPLLFESGWDWCCDEIWCVDALRELRLERSQNRGWDAAELDRREASQMPIETKCRLSNHVMRNDATLEALHKNLRRRWDQLVRMASSQAGDSAADQPPHCTSDRVSDS